MRTRFIAVMAVGIAATWLPLAACSDDSSSGGNQNNQVGHDAAVDGTANSDASSNQDGTMQQDASGVDSAVAHDSATSRDAGNGNGAIGDPCTDASDCAAPQSLTADCMTAVAIIQFKNGYCTASCTPPANNDPDPCGAGAICSGFSGQGKCFKTCSGDEDCRQADGYTCQDPGGAIGQTVCLPPTF